MQWFEAVAQDSLQGRSLRLLQVSQCRPCRAGPSAGRFLAVCRQVLRRIVRQRTVHLGRPPRGQVAPPGQAVARDHRQSSGHRQAQAAQGRLRRADRRQDRTEAQRRRSSAVVDPALVKSARSARKRVQQRVGGVPAR